eukprot:GDKI01017349.1.p1 GENE.GDKI01017349.1~~GDKI01017349.1.p1  ORF type:complete len:570 (-),score=144.69 GDKI01017349.1:1759-3468(-)
MLSRMKKMSEIVTGAIEKLVGSAVVEVLNRFHIKDLEKVFQELKVQMTEMQNQIEEALVDLKQTANDLADDAEIAVSGVLDEKLGDTDLDDFIQVGMLDENNKLGDSLQLPGTPRPDSPRKSGFKPGRSSLNLTGGSVTNVLKDQLSVVFDQGTKAATATGDEHVKAIKSLLSNMKGKADAKFGEMTETDENGRPEWYNMAMEKIERLFIYYVQKTQSKTFGELVQKVNELKGYGDGKNVNGLFGLIDTYRSQLLSGLNVDVFDDVQNEFRKQLLSKFQAFVTSKSEMKSLTEMLRGQIEVVLTEEFSKKISKAISEQSPAQLKRDDDHKLILADLFPSEPEEPHNDPSISVPVDAQGTGPAEAQLKEPEKPASVADSNESSESESSDDSDESESEPFAWEDFVPSANINVFKNYLRNELNQDSQKAHVRSVLSAALQGHLAWGTVQRWSKAKKRSWPIDFSAADSAFKNLEAAYVKFSNSKTGLLPLANVRKMYDAVFGVNGLYLWRESLASLLDKVGIGGTVLRFDEYQRDNGNDVCPEWVEDMFKTLFNSDPTRPKGIIYAKVGVE